MTLGELLEGVKLRQELPSAAAGMPVAGLAYDSRRVGKDFVFFAFAGSRVDGTALCAPGVRARRDRGGVRRSSPGGFRGPLDSGREQP